VDNRSIETGMGERLGASTTRRSSVTSEARRLLEGASRLAREGEDVEVNCRELEQLGGSPLQVLLALAAELDRRGVRLTLADAGPTIARIIALAGLRPERLEI
jgi:anti-anti-sigma regulatory factor